MLIDSTSYGLSNVSLNFYPPLVSFPHSVSVATDSFIITAHGNIFGLSCISFMSFVGCRLLLKTLHGHVIKMFKTCVLCGHLPCLTLYHSTYYHLTHCAFYIFVYYILSSLGYSFMRIDISIDFLVLYPKSLELCLAINSYFRNELGVGEFTD